MNSLEGAAGHQGGTQQQQYTPPMTTQPLSTHPLYAQPMATQSLAQNPSSPHGHSTAWQGPAQSHQSERPAFSLSGAPQFAPGAYERCLGAAYAVGEERDSLWNVPRKTCKACGEGTPSQSNYDSLNAFAGIAEDADEHTDVPEGKEIGEVLELDGDWEEIDVTVVAPKSIAEAFPVKPIAASEAGAWYRSACGAKKLQ